MAWLQANWGWIAVFVVALDHALAAIPAVKASSTAQLILNILSKLLGGGDTPPPSLPSA